MDRHRVCESGRIQFHRQGLQEIEVPVKPKDLIAKRSQNHVEEQDYCTRWVASSHYYRPS